MRLVKRLLLALGGAVCLLSAAPLATAGEPAFIAGLNDVPLMPGLTPAGETLVFDKPGGRIAEASFAGRISSDAVARFYADTLPQLGWRAAGRNRFVRDHEELTLFVRADGPVALRVVVQPRR